MRCRNLIFPATLAFSLLVASCGGKSSSTDNPLNDDADMVEKARQAVIDADKVQYDFNEREPRIDKTDPEFIRIAFVMSARNKMGGDPVVFLSKDDGSVSRIQYTR